MLTLAIAAFVAVFSMLSVYCTKSPTAATVVIVVLRAKSCVAAASTGTSMATVGPASTVKVRPKDPSCKR